MPLVTEQTILQLDHALLVMVTTTVSVLASEQLPPDQDTISLSVLLDSKQSQLQLLDVWHITVLVPLHHAINAISDMSQPSQLVMPPLVHAQPKPEQPVLLTVLLTV